MHKELNAVKGGNTAMMAWWQDQDPSIPGPCLLANKDNAATLHDILLEDDLSSLNSAERRALDVSAAGAVKLASLAGALFNHKDV